MLSPVRELLGDAEGGDVDRGQDDQERQHRQRNHQVGEAHQQPVEPAAVVAGEDADDGADDGGEQRCRDPHQQRDPAAVEQPHQHIAAQLVGAERVGEAGTFQDAVQVHVPDVDAQHPFDHRREQGGENQDQQDEAADHRQPVAQETPQPQPPELGPAGAWSIFGEDAGGGRGHW